ncbi:MAG: hypothetical protein M3Y17_09685 [Actinomycetota bacterium]|nr:hypothetical protein [Actinomycetota bacterium]
MLLAAALLLREAALTAAPPGAVHLLPPLPDRLPQLFRDDPECFVLADYPLRLRLLVRASSTDPRIPTCAGLVPGPPAGVLLVVEDAADRCWRPALGRADPAGHVLLIEPLDDLSKRLTVGVHSEDPQDDSGLLWLDLHVVAVRTRAAFLVHPHLADRDRAVAERLLADEEAALLLAHLTAEGFLLEIAKLEFVEDPSDLDREGRLLIVAIQSVCHGDHADPLERELGDDRQHQVVVAGET